MADPISVSLRFEGNVPDTVHLHLTTDAEAILARFDTQETQMTALTDAVTALQGRIEEDVAELNRKLAEKDGLLQQALATDAADAAAIADLTAQNEALNADIATTVASLSAIDPVADFPAVETPPADVPPADQPPA